MTRKLYLAPIIHMGADMGSLASAMDETAKTELGEEVWQKHKEALINFWHSVAQFFDPLDVKGFKIYQDGLVADGDIGLKIVKEGVSQGSKNYEIVEKLLERGAILLKTEDPALVKKEYLYIKKMVCAKSPREKEACAQRYQRAQGQLLKERDGYIVKRIAETLHDGETGVLFIGAYHDIASKLPADINVVQVKDITEVREYRKSLSGL
jgi:hypothetical protein